MTLDMMAGFGTIAFAISGAMVAIEEKYDLFGVYILGFVTAFGGGAIRNLLIGVPIVQLWQQNGYFMIALAAITLVILMPHIGTTYVKPWTLFDAIGLASFSIQGAIYALDLGLPLSACMAAAVLTGTGGGVVRDMLAGRKPLIFQRDVYALWALFSGLVIGLGRLSNEMELLGLFTVVLCMRLLSVRFGWNLPRPPGYSLGNDSGR